MAKHVTASYLAEQTGFSARQLTGLARQRRIPGAVQPTGPRGGWRFDETLFWRWWHARAQERKWQPSIGAGRRGGAASSVTVTSSADPLKQKIDARLKEFSRAGLQR